MPVPVDHVEIQPWTDHILSDPAARHDKLKCDARLIRLGHDRANQLYCLGAWLHRVQCSSRVATVLLHCPYIFGSSIFGHLSSQRKRKVIIDKAGGFSALPPGQFTRRAALQSQVFVCRCTTVALHCNLQSDSNIYMAASEPMNVCTSMTDTLASKADPLAAELEDASMTMSASPSEGASSQPASSLSLTPVNGVRYSVM